MRSKEHDLLGAQSLAPSLITPLRASHRRARSLDPASQLRELIDQLENPQILAEDLRASAAAISECFDAGDAWPMPGEADGELLLSHFPPRRELTVRAEEPFVFTVVASDVDPLPGLRAAGDACEGFDYLGLLVDRERIGVLGVQESGVDRTPYTLLLRGLAGLAELLPDAQLSRLDRDVFKGALGSQPLLELQLVRFENQAPASPVAEQIAQLTRDLADVVRASLLGETKFAADLIRISCLRMNAEHFDGDLELDWWV